MSEEHEKETRPGLDGAKFWLVALTPATDMVLELDSIDALAAELAKYEGSPHTTCHIFWGRRIFGRVQETRRIELATGGWRTVREIEMTIQPSEDSHGRKES